MTIVHNRQFDPRYGECVPVAPLVRRVVAENPNAFTFTGSGAYLVGRGDVAVIDPGPGLPEHMDAIESCLGPGERIGRILVTHTHTDHTAGVPELARRTGATTFGYGPHGPVASGDPLARLDFGAYITPEENRRFAEEWANLPDELKREGPDLEFHPETVVGHAPVDDRGVSDRIEGEGWAVEVLHTPGHTSNHVCYRLAEDGNGRSVVFTGDHVMGWATSVIAPPDGDLNLYLASLERLLLVDDDYFLPTHGPPIEDPAPYVRSFIDHRNERTAQILAALEAGPRSVVDLVVLIYAGVDKRLWRAAASSVYAHLLALETDGRVRSTDGSGAITAVWSTG